MKNSHGVTLLLSLNQALKRRFSFVVLKKRREEECVFHERNPKELSERVCEVRKVTEKQLRKLFFPVITATPKNTSGGKTT